MDLTNDLDKKRFASAITGMCKIAVHHDTTADREALTQKVFAKSTMSVADQSIFLDGLAKVLSTAAKKGWTHVELAEEAKNSEFATMSEEQADILGQFWKSDLINIRSSVAEAATFNHKLDHFTWRIDVKSEGGDGSNDEPCALLEMNVGDRVSDRQFFINLFFCVCVERHSCCCQWMYGCQCMYDCMLTDSSFFFSFFFFVFLFTFFFFSRSFSSL